MGTVGTNEKCNSPAALGLESKKIQNRQITASSYYDADHRPEEARLNNVECWASGDSEGPAPWLQVDLKETYIITGIQVQGSPGANEWVKELQVQTGETEASLAFIQENGSPKVRKATNLGIMSTVSLKRGPRKRGT